jgi:hypothetical protein
MTAARWGGGGEVPPSGSRGSIAAAALAQRPRLGAAGSSKAPSYEHVPPKTGRVDELAPCRFCGERELVAHTGRRRKAAHPVEIDNELPF